MKDLTLAINYHVLYLHQDQKGPAIWLGWAYKRFIISSKILCSHPQGHHILPQVWYTLRKTEHSSKTTVSEPLL